MTQLSKNFSLLIQLTQREVGARYKGSILGILWSLITPLFLLLIYTFVFGAIFKSKWPTPTDTEAANSLAEFAIILFTGLVIFQLFADVVTRAPSVILDNKNYVTRVVFPLGILPCVLLGTAFIQFLISMSVMVVAVFLTHGYIPWTAAFMPMILIPFCLLTVGLGWFFAALGVFLRDITQFLGTAVSALMFLAPIFFARSVMPEEIGKWTLLNPLTVPVEEMRKILIWGQLPNLTSLTIYTIVASIIAILGWITFKTLRPGFADVI